MTDQDVERINNFIKVVASSKKKYGELILIIKDDEIKHFDCKVPLDILETAIQALDEEQFEV